MLGQSFPLANLGQTTILDYYYKIKHRFVQVSTHDPTISGLATFLESDEDNVMIYMNTNKHDK